MPAPLAIKVGILAATIVVAASVALYESPELRRMAERMRQRIAIALHQLGDSISPAERENLFNRPEDAQGFLLSRGIDIGHADHGVDADDESRRRQREELLYWNSIAEQRRSRPSADSDKDDERPKHTKRGSSFDDFMKQDSSAEKGALVFHTGTDVRAAEKEGLRRRGEGAHGLHASVYTNPFADEHGIDEHVVMENNPIDPDEDEVESEVDIYSISAAGKRLPSGAATPVAPADHKAGSTDIPSPVRSSCAATLSAPLEHIPEPVRSVGQLAPPSERSATMGRELDEGDRVTAGQSGSRETYNSIHAWAQNSMSTSYSPLPVSPETAMSEAEWISEGALTPIYSASVDGSGVEVDGDVSSPISRQGGALDVISDDDGMVTPSAWSEIGSVVSGSAPVHP